MKCLVWPFRNSQKPRKKKVLKKFQTPRKKNVFKFCKTIFLVFKVQNEFYSFSPIFRAIFSMKMTFFLFSPKFIMVFKCFKAIFSIFQPFQYDNKNLFVFPKFCFQNLIFFKCFKTFYSVFQPFYEIPKRLEKQCCILKSKTPTKTPSQKLKRLQKQSFSKTLHFTILNCKIVFHRFIGFLEFLRSFFLLDILLYYYIIFSILSAFFLFIHPIPSTPLHSPLPLSPIYTFPFPLSTAP